MSAVQAELPELGVCNTWNIFKGQAWWHVLGMPTLRRWKQGDAWDLQAAQTCLTDNEQKLPKAESSWRTAPKLTCEPTHIHTHTHVHAHPCTHKTQHKIYMNPPFHFQILLSMHPFPKFHHTINFRNVKQTPETENETTPTGRKVALGCESLWW